MFESIKALEIKTSMLFNLDFANNTILSCFFFLIIHLYFLIPAVVQQISNPIAGIVISIGIPNKEAKAEMETHPVLIFIYVFSVIIIYFLIVFYFIN